MFEKFVAEHDNIPKDIRDMFEKGPPTAEEIPKIVILSPESVISCDNSSVEPVRDGRESVSLDQWCMNVLKILDKININWQNQQNRKGQQSRSRFSEP
ncbi:hypothetical protein TKK_0019556 [Trichogramma kaykai]